MKIKKIYQGTIPTNKILNEKTESNTDTYSCDYINGLGTSEITSKKQCIIVGDSFTSTDNASIEARGGADTWVTKFATITNLECFNYAEGGAGFYQKGLINNRNFNDQINATTTNENIKSNLVESIIIYGGINDINANVGESNIISGLNDLLTSCKTLYPTSKVYLFFFNNGNYTINEVKLNLINKVLNEGSYKNIFAHQSATWLIGGEHFTSDNVHPNSSGMNLILTFILQSIYGGDGLNIPINVTNVQFTNEHYTGDVQHTILSNTMYYNPLKDEIKGSVNINLKQTNAADPSIEGTYIITTDVSALTGISKALSSNYVATSRELITNCYIDGLASVTNNQTFGFVFRNIGSKVVTLNNIYMTIDCKLL